MSGKKRLLDSLNHRSSEGVPVDFGGTPVTGIHVEIVEKLRQQYGFEARPVKVIEPSQMLGEIDDELMDALGVDVVGISPRNTMFGFPLGDWKEFKTPWGQEVLVPGKFMTKYQDNDLYLYPQGDVNAQPSASMSEAGYFFDSIIRQPPIDDDNLNPDDNLEEFGHISDEDVRYFKEETDRLSTGGRGVAANFGGTAFGDIALVPAPFLKDPKGIRDISEWYVSTATRQEYIHQVFTKQLEYALANLKKIHDAVGDNVQVVFLCGADFGTQRSLFFSPDTFRDLWLPYYKSLNDWIHANTSWKTFKHSCGAISEIMDLFIESGFDIINPVQLSAEGMDAQDLKNNYGEQITFWGGGVDTQNTLPFGSPEMVRKEVLERCEILSKNGGFVFNSIHNVQSQSPIENVMAMIDAVKEFNG